MNTPVVDRRANHRVRKVILACSLMAGIWCMWPVFMAGSVADRQNVDVDILAYEFIPVSESQQRLHIIYEYVVELDDAFYGIMASQRADIWGNLISDPLLSNDVAQEIDALCIERGSMNGVLGQCVLYYDSKSPSDSARLYVMEDLSRYRIGSLLLCMPVIYYLLFLCIGAFALNKSSKKE